MTAVINVVIPSKTAHHTTTVLAPVIILQNLDSNIHDSYSRGLSFVANSWIVLPFFAVPRLKFCTPKAR